jgi:hypothetical protein
MKHTSSTTSLDHRTIAWRQLAGEHLQLHALIEQEADLDKQFASRTVTPESLRASIASSTSRLSRPYSS